MQSQEEDRHAQGRKLCDLWAGMEAGAPRSGGVTDQERKDVIISNLSRLFGQEVFEEVAADAVGRMFCDLLLVLDPAAGKRFV